MLTLQKFSARTFLDYLKGLLMRKDYYTLLIIPQEKSSIKKFKISTNFLRIACAAVVLSFLSVLYISYEVVQVRSKAGELAELKQLSDKVGDLERAMVDLRQFDKKIRIMTNLEKDHGKDQILGIGGPSSEEGYTGTGTEDVEKVLIEEIHKNLDSLLDEAVSRKSSLKELVEFLEKQKSVLASTPSIWPVVGWVTSEFGYRVSPFTGKREFHRGIDIAAKLGDEIVASADGVVSSVSKDRYLGNTVKINHGNGITSCYGHMLKADIKARQKVKRGDVIGYVGNSGRSTGPHLHYGLLVKNVYVNPRKYIF